MSHDYPRAMRGVDWTSKAGLDNPDNNYFLPYSMTMAAIAYQASEGILPS